MATESDPFSNNVSVIVLNYNQAATTVECLDALARARSDLIREIVVVDNGSDPAELAILHERHAQADFVLVEVGVNRFFGEGNNIGVDHAHGDYIVFLNNDAFVQPGWIEALCSTMRSDPLVAAVGPMFLYPDGRVQEVGGVIVPTGDAVQIGKGAVWGPDHYDTPVPRRLLLGRLPHDAARRLPQGGGVRPGVGARLLRGHRPVPEALDPVRQGHGEPECPCRPHREQDDVRPPAPVA